MCNCVRDGSRSSGIALQEEVSNHSELRRGKKKADVVSVREKASPRRQVRIKEMKR
ncbi:MAG: hypothetical protein LBG20_01385 [Holosporaceae bacterium]|nr:hypothetical protein [Holosporaceae bacterium]